MKVGVFTTTRAEFSIYLPLLRALDQHPRFSYCLFVGGSHLSAEHGETIEEIRASGVNVTDTFPYLEAGSEPEPLAIGLSSAVAQVAKLFQTHEFDLLVVVGDRYEILAQVASALIFGKPILHIHGGERTEGAIDEQVRHMTTKASHIHAVACPEYRDNVLSLGEEPWRVHVTGALGIDQLLSEADRSRSEIFRTLEMDEAQSVAVVTYHPVTLGAPISHSEQIDALFEALDAYHGQLVVTLPGADRGADEIIERTRLRASERGRCKVVSSLGSENYLSLLRYCDFVIGNSSSAIIEAPFLRIPTIDIGDRQKGRYKHPSVLSANYSCGSMAKCISVALSDTMKRRLVDMPFRFGDGHAASRIVSILEELPPREKLLNKRLCVGP